LTSATSRWTGTGCGEISSAASAVMTASVRLRKQGRAREQRDPIEFSFHDFDFLCVFVVEVDFSSA